MKLTVQRKGICVLLILTMIVSGMCFDSVKAGACFLHTETSGTAIQSYTNNNGVGKQHAFLDEQAEKIEEYHVSVQGNNRKDTRTRNFGGLLFSLSAFFRRGRLYSVYGTAHYIVPKNLVSTAIIAYVHHQDGYKDLPLQYKK